MNRLKILFIIVILCSTSLKAQNLNSIYESMGEGNWEIALEQLQPYLAKKKKKAEVLWLAAICHMQRYRFNQSFQYFEEAKEFAEIDPFYYVPYAQAYLFSGNPDQAERVLRRLNIQNLEPEFRPDYLKVQSQIRNAKVYLKNLEPHVVKNLGPNINSRGNEYSQVVTSDERGIYFTARREGLGERADDGEYYEHLMQSFMNDRDEWSRDEEVKGYNTGKDFIAPLQLLDNDSTVVYFKNDDIYIGRMHENGRYVGEEDLHINTNGWESHAHLFDNENSIIFSSDRGNDKENSDLYISHKNADGSWSEPEFINELNTEENEDAPFVAADGTLYFSSRGHDSMGGYDIFKTRFDSATGQFAKPQNMGAPINLPGDDTFFTLYGQYAYFSSSRPNGYGENDIYKAFLFNKSQLQGKLIDCNRRPFANAQVKITKVTTGEIEETTTNEFGVYYINTPIEAEVMVEITHDDQTIYDQSHYFRILFRDQNDIEHDFRIGDCADSKPEVYLSLINSYDLDPLNIDVPEPSVEGLLIEVATEEVITQVEDEQIFVNEAPIDEKSSKAVVAVMAIPDIKLPIVYFDFDKSIVKEEYFKKLNAAAELLKERTDLKVLVAGHTDDYGENPYNISLGEKRSKAVIKYLIDKGVDPDQLVGDTFSEDIPIASNRTRQGRAFNRRVELSFIE